MLLSTIFQSYHNGIWLQQGAQCSLLKCCLTEVSCPRHLIWYHIQSHYTDTGSTNPSSTPYVWVPSEEQLVPFLTTLVCRGLGLTSRSLERTLYLLSYRGRSKGAVRMANCRPWCRPWSDWLSDRVNTVCLDLCPKTSDHYGTVRNYTRWAELGNKHFYPFPSSFKFWYRESRNRIFW